MFANADGEDKAIMQQHPISGRMKQWRPDHPPFQWTRVTTYGAAASCSREWGPAATLQRRNRLLLKLVSEFTWCLRRHLGTSLRSLAKVSAIQVAGSRSSFP